VSVSAVCPGSFDPIHHGHLDVVERAAARFDRVVVAVLVNPSKQGLFSIDDRLDLIRRTTAHLDNVEVDSFQGLLVDFCHAHDIDLICKGLRAASDFEYELQMAQMNERIGDVATVFMSTSPEWSFLSSSLVKEVARLGGRIEGTVPPLVEEAIRDRLAAGG
jgi:pantetheine-phosphate adenylyltransferase